MAEKKDILSRTGIKSETDLRRSIRMHHDDVFAEYQAKMQDPKFKSRQLMRFRTLKKRWRGMELEQLAEWCDFVTKCMTTEGLMSSYFTLFASEAIQGIRDGARAPTPTAICNAVAVVLAMELRDDPPELRVTREELAAWVEKQKN